MTVKFLPALFMGSTRAARLHLKRARGTRGAPAFDMVIEDEEGNLANRNNCTCQKSRARGQIPRGKVAPSNRACRPRGTLRISRRQFLVIPVRTNNSDLGAVRHAELAHDLPNMNLYGTFPHPQPACNSFIRLATAQQFKDGLLSRR